MACTSIVCARRHKHYVCAMARSMHGQAGRVQRHGHKRIQGANIVCTRWHYECMMARALRVHGGIGRQSVHDGTHKHCVCVMAPYYVCTMARTICVPGTTRHGRTAIYIPTCVFIAYDTAASGAYDTEARTYALCVYMHDGMGITHIGMARMAARAHASRCAYARSGGARAAARAQTHPGRKHRVCALALCAHDGTGLVVHDGTVRQGVHDGTHKCCVCAIAPYYVCTMARAICVPGTPRHGHTTTYISTCVLIAYDNAAGGTHANEAGAAQRIACLCGTHVA
jgi:hypothetical protein